MDPQIVAIIAVGVALATLIVVFVTPPIRALTSDISDWLERHYN